MSGYESLVDGLLLVGHGTREAAGVAEFWETVRLVRECLANGNFAAERFFQSPAPSLQPPVPVHGCFLEHAAPTIAEGVAAAYRDGVRSLAVVPVVLFSAGHARRDIPRAVAAAARACPGLTWRQAAHLGCRESLLLMSAQRCRRALAEAAVHVDQDPALPETVCILVGRGSSEASATQEMLEFARLRHRALPLASTEVAFVALAEPRLADLIRSVGQRRPRWVVVQPHLLFAGELVTRIRQRTADAQREWPDTTWLAADHLGPSPELAAALLDIAWVDHVSGPTDRP